jgi:hypothetical protein
MYKNRERSKKSGAPFHFWSKSGKKHRALLRGVDDIGNSRLEPTSS